MISCLTKPSSFVRVFRYLFIPVFVFILTSSTNGQGCTNLGQTPSTAFPVCGTGVFSQGNVPSCSNSRLVVPGCGSENTYEDANPFWYKFTCFSSGTLGLLIDPISANDDYDWQVWDITGIDPNSVFNNGSKVVVANWSGLRGQTGTNTGARNLIECGSFNNNNPPKFSRMPTITAGHTYILMVSNFSNSQQGYKLSFGGGTAVITDPKEPLMASVTVNCGADELRLKLNKKMKCNTIAANGSDIAPFPGGITATSVRTIGCSGGFESDSLIITLSTPLPPGNYALHLQNGSDGNTILDLCDRAIPTTNQLSFEVKVLQPTPFDSIVPVSCAPAEVSFRFARPIRCSSVDPSGSDFSVSGTYPVTISRVRGECNADGLTNTVIVTFNQLLQQKGTFTVSLKRGIDGNTLIDECNQETPVGQITFSVKDTVSAAFNYSIRYGCLADTVTYTHPGGNEINSWIWSFDKTGIRSGANQQVIYDSFGDKVTSLVVTNGFCSDTSAQTIHLNNFLKADFTVDPYSCPGEPTVFTGTLVSERPVTHFWTLGDGTSSADTVPRPHIYPSGFYATTYTIRYTITNDLGCTSTAQKNTIVLMTCRIDVPTAFTPNGDQLNDTFGPLNAPKAEQLVFRVFNRWGNLLFETNNWLRKWDGMYKSAPQPAGTYIWYMSYIDKDSKKPILRKGTFELIR